MMEEILQEEVEQALGTRRGERAADCRGYGHGGKARGLALHSGTVKLEVPRARLVNSGGKEREWRSRLLPRYRRGSPEVECLSGRDTGRIQGALTPLPSGAGSGKLTYGTSQL